MHLIYTVNSYHNSINNRISISDPKKNNLEKVELCSQLEVNILKFLLSLYQYCTNIWYRWIARSLLD